MISKFRTLTPLFVAATHFIYANAQEGNPYIEAGMPAASRPWIDLDYIAVAQVLSSKKVPLPRYSTSDGSELLKRMTNRDNFKHLQNKNIGLQSRIMAMSRINQSLDVILGLYREENQLNPCFAERASLICLAIYFGASTISIIEDVEAFMQKNGKKENDMSIIDTFYSQQTLGIALGETMISYNVFPDSQHTSAILNAMAETLPTVLPHLKPDYKQEERRKLEKLRTRFIGTKDLATLNKIIIQLQP